MQRSRNVPEKGRTTAPKQSAPRGGNNVRAQNAQRSNAPRGANSQTVSRNGANSSLQQRSAAPVGNERIAPVSATRPNATAKQKAVPMPVPKGKVKQKKEPVEKIKQKKKKKEKDPNRIRILSFEGRVDIPMLITTLVLLAFGITMMFSASHAYSYRDNNGDSYAYVTRQMTAAVIGLVGMMFLTLFDYRFLRHESKRLHILNFL